MFLDSWSQDPKGESDSEEGRRIVEEDKIHLWSKKTKKLRQLSQSGRKTKNMDTDKYTKLKSEIKN